MDITKKIGEAYSFVSNKVSASKHLDNASFTAFLVSLLPIPIVSQSAAILDRIAADQSTKNELDSVWNSLKAANARLNEQDDSIERIQQIANTVQFNTAISERLNSILAQIVQTLAAENSEWEVLTKNWSYQAILNSLVHVDSAAIAAINNSHNLIQNTQIHAKKTQLLADGNSSNIVDKSSFHGPSGTISMDALRTQGPIHVEGSSVGFGPGGSIGFGEDGVLGFGPPQPQPTSLNGQCSNCRKSFYVDVRHGIPTQVQCPHCGTRLRTQ